MNDDNSHLTAGISANENRSKICGWAVVAGLVIEVILAVVYRGHTTWLENWAPVFADVLIALGVYGEIHFAGKASKSQETLRQRSEERVAEATERAALANQRAEEARERTAEIEKLTAFRRISHAQLEKIRDSLKDSGTGLDVLVEYQAGDAEAFVYARDIVTTLVGTTAVRTGPNSYPGAGLFGLFIAASPSVDIEIVAKSLADAGLEFSRFDKDLSTHLPRGVPAPNLYMFVAPKPPPVLIPPTTPPVPIAT